MMQIYTIARINSILTLVLGCPANLLLIWLILCRTSRELQIWSRVLFQSAIIDLALVFTAFTTQCAPVSEGPNFYWVILGPWAHIQNTTLQYAGCLFWTFLLEFAKYAVVVQYFYRWLVVCREREITICQYCLCLCIPVILANVFIALLFISIYRQSGNSVANSDQSEVYLFSLIAGKVNIVIPRPHIKLRSESCGPFNPQLFGPKMTVISDHLFTNIKDGIFDKLTLIMAIMCNVSTALIIILCNYLIWRKSRQNLMPEQQKSVEISRQVGRVLLIQAIIPIALQMLPLVILSITIMIGQEFSSLSSFLYSQTWTSCIYPVATMSIVGHYRRQIKKMMVCWKNNTASVHVHPSTE